MSRVYAPIAYVYLPHWRTLCAAGVGRYRMHLKEFADSITSKFYANACYTSSIFYALKFFFENNTKHLRALDMLGSLYRSSKWGGPKLRNVNSTSLLRWYLAAAFGLILCYFIVNPPLRTYGRNKCNIYDRARILFFNILT